MPDGPGLKSGRKSYCRILQNEQAFELWFQFENRSNIKGATAIIGM